MTMKVTGRGLEFRDAQGRLVTAITQEEDGDVVAIRYSTNGNEVSRAQVAGASAGTLLVAADFALSANWGVGATVTVTAGSTSRRWRITITAAGTPGAAPTVTLTFPDGPWPAGTRWVVIRAGGSGAGSVIPSWSNQPTTTSGAFVVAGTPVAAATYVYEGTMT